jgi:Acetyltransferase (GNAT) family
VQTRWRADPSATFAALQGGELLGSNFATRWGSFGFFGPLSVRPNPWDRGVARKLLDATMDRFDAWGVAHRGLFTFAQSAKHVGLYQRYGFYPRFLTAVMSKPVAGGPPTRAVEHFSALAEEARNACLSACHSVTDAIFDDLDVGAEIRAVRDQALGETLLVSVGGTLCAFAVCHVGAGSEAGSDVCYAKFAAVRPGADAAADFEPLLDACERFAAARGATQLVVGVNTAREAAYRRLLARGFRTVIQGVAMQSPNEMGYNRPDVFVIDDWR